MKTLIHSMSLVLLQVLLRTAFCLAAEPQSSPSCAPVSGSEKVLRAEVVLMLGELHGTNQAPAILTNLTCAALDSGLAVTVALEIPDEEQARLDKFLASSGTEQDFAELLKGFFWRRQTQDGRSSKAMAQMIENLRQLQIQPNNNLRVILIDNPTAVKGRDNYMASQLKKQINESPKRLIITLTGNWHNQIIRGSSFDADFESMGYLLKQWLPKTEIISLDMIHNGGSAWVCLAGEECGSVRQGSIADGEGIKLYPPNEFEQYSGFYFVGEISASSPASAQ